jgi:hypothetical protein
MEAPPFDTVPGFIGNLAAVSSPGHRGLAFGEAHLLVQDQLLSGRNQARVAGALARRRASGAGMADRPQTAPPLRRGG